jgi:predicted DCC family thiol-disulfide oxidoreductase YuxK
VIDLDQICVKIVNLTDEQLVHATRSAIYDVLATPRWRWFRRRQLNILILFLDVEVNRRLSK